MNTKGKYTISIKVTNNFTEETICNIETGSINDLQGRIRMVEKAINKYDNNNYRKCKQCNEYNHIHDMSKPEDLDELFCQECLQRLMDGDIELNTNS